MNGFFSSFAIGLFCTISLFVLCFLIVIGGKTVYERLKTMIEKPKIAPPKKENTQKPKKQPKPKSPPIVRTIEIDPAQVDRIYVKKAQ